MYPDELKYTEQHEWARAGDQAVVRVGITHYAQQALGDIVYVTLPAVGSEVVAGQPFGEVESTKSISEVYAPVSGRVVGRNDRLDDAPELINSDPYGEGWIVDIDAADPTAVAGLMDAADYQDLVARA